MEKTKYHLIGIGGIGVGALALLLLEKGFEVSGSDVQENEIVRKLRKKGAQIFIGHARENVAGRACVVYSSAIKSDNPEIIEAKKKNIPILRRAELLAGLMKDYIAITVAGAHGKTTTTSLVSHLLQFAGLDPTSAIGGVVHGVESNANLGKGQYFVAEADESDGTFLNYFPNYSIITNIDLEHVDHFENLENVLAAYKKFILNTNPDGKIIACGDDQQLLEVLRQSGRLFQTYGIKSDSDVTARKIRQEGFRSFFECVVQKKAYGEVQLNIPGQHNILNALAAISLGISLGIDFEVIALALKDFQGVHRRFDVKGEAHGITVIDDYAHHPSEIAAVLETACLLESKRLVVVFQPHRYTRLAYFMDDFVESLKCLDVLIVTDVYAASEKKINGIDSKALVERIGSVSRGFVKYVSEKALNDYLCQFLAPGDVLLTLGAGNITYMADELLKILHQSNSENIKLEA